MSLSQPWLACLKPSAAFTSGSLGGEAVTYSK
jgi:hypothetical protein